MCPDEIKVRQILKNMLWVAYYKLCLEKSQKTINPYYALSNEEIEKLLEELPYFVSPIINYAESCYDYTIGCYILTAEIGMIKSQYAEYPKNRIKKTIALGVKKIYQSIREVDVEVLVISLTENKVKIAFAISEFGSNYIKNIEIQKKNFLQAQKKLLAEKEQKAKNF